MFRVAVIGAGQLGSRHLQGLARLELPCEVFVVDPSVDSLVLARRRFEEMPANPAVRGVHFASSAAELPSELDYAIVATTADVRLKAMRSLLDGRTVRAMLLEKVLFQRAADFEAAAALLHGSGTRAWVNCPRRIFPIYADVKQFLAGQPLLGFQAAGGGWGLGCNSIHFLDLLGFLTGQRPDDISASGLDEALIPSKRRNFMEFTGSLRGRFGATRFELASFAQSSARLIVTIRGESRSCVIDETAGKAFLLDDRTWETQSFTVPLLSEQATSVAAGLLSEGRCALSTFDESASHHLPLLAALGAHAAARTELPAGICPIT